MAADNSKIVYGGDMMIFVSSGSTKEPLAFSTSAKLDMSVGTRDVSSKDDGNWSEFLKGKYSWNASSDGLLSFTGATAYTGTNTMEKLFTYFNTGALVNFVFASKTGTSPAFTVDATKKNFTGTCLITALSLNASDGDNATYSISLQGSGALVMV